MGNFLDTALSTFPVLFLPLLYFSVTVLIFNLDGKVACVVAYIFAKHFGFCKCVTYQLEPSWTLKF